ncbi:FecR family protein [Pedobacter nutrimenti]|uniref:FecR family protein n=1 Tax=Pedobacter nutrimenti TaxID=1241337 RepID=UPI00292F5FA7|nr:FecR domain-containing protein [Pedobacter nutrimenti]
MKNKAAEELFNKYLNRETTAAEDALIESWYIDQGLKSPPIQQNLSYQTIQDRIWSKITSDRSKSKKIKIQWLCTAAAIALAFFGTVFYQLRDKPSHKNYTAKITPGKIGATLTLSNGKKITLEDAANGELANEAGIRIAKTKAGEIVYEIKEVEDGANKTNTLTTAKGEVYTLLLPDKTKVWMNAASSLTYTTNLDQHGVRLVKLEGEAYFEVSKDPRRPFIVQSRNQQVQVLGTHFNINAYNDEWAIKTTLLEGSVKINDNIILKPNQQAIVSPQDTKVIPVIADAFIDWKQGDFNFENESLSAIMRKISRWYDVQVIYQGTENNKDTYTGTISRSSDINKVLQSITATTDYRFSIKDRTIFVSK